MTDAIIGQIITGVVTVSVAGISAYFAYASKRQSEANEKSIAATKAVAEDTHKAVNGKMDEFKRMAEKYFHAEGVLSEKADEQVRKDITAAAIASVPAALPITNPPTPR